MKWNRGIVSACLCAMLSAALGTAQTTDVKNSKDHPLVSRYPGAAIVKYSEIAFDEFTLPLGKLKPGGTLEKSARLEGKITRIGYAIPAGRSILEVYRNYESGLTKAGFDVLYSCVNIDGCGTGNVLLHGASGKEDWAWGAGQRYLSAKRTTAEGVVHVSLHLGQWTNLARGQAAVLYVIESKPMEQGLVTVDAAALANDLSRSGHSSVYGIYFDTGKAEVKPESEAALKEIGKLLRENAGLKLLVVGHTDNVGSLASNMDLSKRRADAVVQALSVTHGIPANRLMAQGAGQLAPVASNKTEEGRAKNRRVELVEQ